MFSIVDKKSFKFSGVGSTWNKKNYYFKFLAAGSIENVFSCFFVFFFFKFWQIEQPKRKKFVEFLAMHKCWKCMVIIFFLSQWIYHPKILFSNWKFIFYIFKLKINQKLFHWNIHWKFSPTQVYRNIFTANSCFSFFFLFFGPKWGTHIRVLELHPNLQYHLNTIRYLPKNYLHI